MTARTPEPRPYEITSETLLEWLIGRIAARLDVPAERIDGGSYVDELDLDSMDAMLVMGQLEQWLGFDLGASTALRYSATLRDLAEALADEYLQQRARARAGDPTGRR